MNMCSIWNLHPPESRRTTKRNEMKEKEMKKSLWLIHVNKKIYHNEYGSDFDYPNIKHHIKSTAWHSRHHSIGRAQPQREVNNCISGAKVEAAKALI